MIRAEGVGECHWKIKVKIRVLHATNIFQKSNILLQSYKNSVAVSYDVP